jgi:hypothetical protein
LNEIVENEASCTYACTPRPVKRVRIAWADNDAKWADVDPVPDIAVYPLQCYGARGAAWMSHVNHSISFLHFTDSEIVEKNEITN